MGFGHGREEERRKGAECKSQCAGYAESPEPRFQNPDEEEREEPKEPALPSDPATQRWTGQSARDGQKAGGTPSAALEMHAIANLISLGGSSKWQAWE